MDKDYFNDDLDPVKKKGGTFDYTCEKCGKVEKNQKTVFNVMGTDLCMDCWFNYDYKKEEAKEK